MRSRTGISSFPARTLVIAGGRGLESFESTLQSLGAGGPVVALTLYNTELYGQGEEAAGGEGRPLHRREPAPVHGHRRREASSKALPAPPELYPQHAEAVFCNMPAGEERLDALETQMRSVAADAEGGRVIIMNEALVYCGGTGAGVAGSYARRRSAALRRRRGRLPWAAFGDGRARGAGGKARPRLHWRRRWKKRATSSPASTCCRHAAPIWARRDIAAQEENARAVMEDFRAPGGNALKEVTIYTDGACSGQSWPGRLSSHPHLSGQARRAFRYERTPPTTAWS